MSDDPIDFYGGPFSNFAASPIEMNVGWGFHEYPTVEHAFQAAKAVTDDDHQEIRMAPSPSIAKTIGRRIKLRPDWEEMKYEIMLDLLRAKFAIPYFRSELLATGDREIREDSPTDRVWGARDGGQNLLGKALMQVRSEIREGTT